MHPAIGDHDHSGKPIGWHVGQRRIKRSEQTRAVGLAVSFASLNNADLQAGNPVQLFEHVRAGGLGLLHAVAEVLARTLVDDHDRYRSQRIAIFVRERWVGERQRDQCQSESSQGGAAAARRE